MQVKSIFEKTADGLDLYRVTSSPGSIFNKSKIATQYIMPNINYSASYLKQKVIDLTNLVATSYTVILGVNFIFSNILNLAVFSKFISVLALLTSCSIFNSIFIAYASLALVRFIISLPFVPVIFFQINDGLSDNEFSSMSMKDLKAKFNFENYGHMSVTNFEIVEITNEHGTYRGLLVIKDASSNDYKIIGRGNGCAIEHMIDASDDNENILIMSYCKKNGWLKGGLPFFRIFSHYWSHVGVVKALSAGVTFLEQRGATKINMYGQSLGGHHIPQILKYNPLNKEGVNYSMQLDVSFPNLDKLASRIVFGGLPKKVLEWFVDPLVKLIFFTLRLRSDFKLENYIDTVNKLTHLRIGNVENDQIVKLPASFYQYIQDNKGEFTAEAAKKIHVQLDNELNILVWKKCDNGYFRHSIVKRKDFYNEINKSELKVEEHATCNEEDVSFSQIPYSDVTRRDPSMYVEVPNVYVNGRPLNSFEESLRAVDSEPSHNEFKFDEKNWQPLVEEEVAE